VNARPGKAAEIVTFLPEENNVTEFRPYFSGMVENMLPTYSNIDPSGTVDSDLFGRAVYSLASRENPQNPLDSKAIKSSMETTYSSFFASMVSSYVFQPSENARTLNATHTEQLTRLIVVPPVAWTVVFTMCLILVCNIRLIFYTKKRKSILDEEPVGLLGSAKLLQDSDICKFVSGLRNSGSPDCAFREMMKRDYELVNSRCWYDKGTKSIRLSGMQRVVRNPTEIIKLLQSAVE
jgi:hypothetical protein